MWSWATYSKRHIQSVFLVDEHLNLFDVLLEVVSRYLNLIYAGRKG